MDCSLNLEWFKKFEFSRILDDETSVTFSHTIMDENSFQQQVTSRQLKVTVFGVIILLLSTPEYHKKVCAGGNELDNCQGIITHTLYDILYKKQQYKGSFECHGIYRTSEHAAKLWAVVSLLLYVH